MTGALDSIIIPVDIAEVTGTPDSVITSMEHRGVNSIITTFHITIEADGETVVWNS